MKQIQWTPCFSVRPGRSSMRPQVTHEQSGSPDCITPLPSRASLPRSRSSGVAIPCCAHPHPAHCTHGQPCPLPKALLCMPTHLRTVCSAAARLEVTRPVVARPGARHRALPWARTPCQRICRTFRKTNRTRHSCSHSLISHARGDVAIPASATLPFLASTPYRGLS